MPALANTFLFVEPDDNSKYAHPLHPNLNPSSALAHILGVLHGDGFVCVAPKACYIIGMRTVKRKFAESFANSLSEIGLHPVVYGQTLKTKLYGKKYVTNYTDVRAYSKMFLTWFKGLNIDAISKLLSNQDEKIAFLRGLYESEGSFGHWKRWNGRQWTFRIVMTNKEILTFSKSLFAELGYVMCLTKGAKTCTGKQLYSLDIRGIVVPEIIKLLNPCIKGEEGYARAC